MNTYDEANTNPDSSQPEPAATPNTARRHVARAEDALDAGMLEILPPPRRDRFGDRSWTEATPSAPPRRGRGVGWLTALAASALVLLPLCAAAYVMIDGRRQAADLTDGARENAVLAHLVSTLNVRLQELEKARGADELADLRRSVIDLKGASATSRELSAAINELSQRVESLDREQGAKLDKLGELSERLNREATQHAAELSARIDSLEKKPAAPAPASAGEPPKLGPNVAMEPTGSIGRPRPILRGYVVLGAQDDVALIGGRYGERAVRAGDWLPGAGRVQRVQRQGSNWVVVTEQGLIAPAYPSSD